MICVNDGLRYDVIYLIYFLPFYILSIIQIYNVNVNLNVIDFLIFLSLKLLSSLFCNKRFKKVSLYFLN